MIEINGLTKRYDDKTAVDGLSLVVEPGVPASSPWSDSSEVPYSSLPYSQRCSAAAAARPCTAWLCSP